jgi:hypothetical protein
MSETLQVGTISRWDPDRFFGFVAGADRKTYFFHGTRAVQADRFRENMQVVYTLAQSRTHPDKQEAVCVKPLDSFDDRLALLSMAASIQPLPSGLLKNVMGRYANLLSGAFTAASVLNDLTMLGMIPSDNELILTRFYLDGVIPLSSNMYGLLSSSWSEYNSDRQKGILVDMGSEAGAFCIRIVQNSLVELSNKEPRKALEALSGLIKALPSCKAEIMFAVCSERFHPLFDLLRWITFDGDRPDYCAIGNVISGLSAEEQRMLLKKIFREIEAAPDPDILNKLLDFVWTDISTWVVLELLGLIRSGQVIDPKKIEKEVYSYVVKHIESPDSVIDVSGYFDECEGVAGCKLSDAAGNELKEMPADKREQEEVRVDIFRYRPGARTPFWCEGRLSAGVHNKTQQAFWWCRNGICFKHSIPENGHDDFHQYTFWDFRRILNLDYSLMQYQMLLSVLNRVQRFLKHLKCRDCGEIMHPKGQGNYSFYRVSHFVCKNDQCANKEVVYLSHCLNGACPEIIDSRDCAKCKPQDVSQTDYGWYVCRSCYSCCTTEKIKTRAGYLETNGECYKGHVEGHKDRGEICCPDCGSVMKFLSNGYADKVNEWLQKKKDTHPSVFRYGINQLGPWFLMHAQGFGSPENFSKWLDRIQEHGFAVTPANTADKFFVRPPVDSKIWVCECGHRLDLNSISNDHDYQRLRALVKYHDSCEG